MIYLLIGDDFYCIGKRVWEIAGGRGVMMLDAKGDSDRFFVYVRQRSLGMFGKIHERRNGAKDLKKGDNGEQGGYPVGEEVVVIQNAVGNEGGLTIRDIIEHCKVSTLIFIEKSSAGGLKRKFPKESNVEEWFLPEPNHFRAWFLKRVAELGLRLQPSVVSLFEEVYPQHPHSALQELVKLKMYHEREAATKGQEDKEAISPSAVARLVRLPLESEVFNLVSALLEKSWKRTYFLFQKEQALGLEAPQIIGILAKQVRTLLLLRRTMSGERLQPKKLGLHPFYLRKMTILSRRYSERELEEFLKLLSQLDIQAKTASRSSAFALEELLFALSS